jgi:hypothetical protein
VTIKNSVLALAMGVLLFAEFLHPAFHNHHDTCSRQESQCFTGKTPALVNSDLKFTHVDSACSICASAFLKYYAGDSVAVVLCSYQDSAALLPQNFVFVKTHFTGSPRAPPVFS